jgi:hypothetical protein
MRVLVAVLIQPGERLAMLITDDPTLARLLGRPPIPLRDVLKEALPPVR